MLRRHASSNCLIEVVPQRGINLLIFRVLTRLVDLHFVKQKEKKKSFVSIRDISHGHYVEYVACNLHVEVYCCIRVDVGRDHSDDRRCRCLEDAGTAVPFGLSTACGFGLAGSPFAAITTCGLAAWPRDRLRPVRRCLGVQTRLEPVPQQAGKRRDGRTWWVLVASEGRDGGRRQIRRPS
jgi:hypothetical protein